MKQSRRAHYVLIFILTAFTLVAALYLRSVPIFENADEAEHLLFMHYLLENGELPVIQSGAEMAAQTDLTLQWNNQSHHAPLYYLLGAGLISWTQRDDIRDYLRTNELIFLRDTTENNANKWLHLPTAPTGDTHLAVYTLRLASIVLGCATLLLIHRAASYFFTNATGPLLTTAFAATLPTFIVVHSSVSNDALVIFFYTAGIAWMLRVYSRRSLNSLDTALISLILAGIALTKLTGVSLVGLVVTTLALGAWRGHWRWFDAVRTLVIALIALAALAGWWYLRNWQIYGDPLALTATASIWGRSEALTLTTLADNLRRVAQSFWAMVGYLHEPVYAPPAAYSYAGAISLVALAGLLVVIRRPMAKSQRDMLGLLALSIGLVTFMLLWGTRSVDISYGRLLLPALVAVAALYVSGWQALLQRFAGIFLLPMVLLAIAMPLIIVPRAYPTLEAVETLPSDALPIDAKSDALEVVALNLHSPSVLQPDDTLSLDLYLRGNHPDNPALLVTAADSLRAVRLGHIEIFPGMAATDSLGADQLYRVPVRIPLDERPDQIREPRLMTILFKFVNLEDDRTLLFDNGESLIEVFGPTFYDPRYEAQPLSQMAELSFGDQIALDSYTLPDEVIAGEPLAVQFNWRPVQEMAIDWTLTLQLRDAAGEIVAQADGMPYWYPTTAWVDGVRVTDNRTIELPADLATGDYRLAVGWYRQLDDDSFERLPLADDLDSDLFILDVTVTAP